MWVLFIYKKIRITLAARKKIKYFLYSYNKIKIKILWQNMYIPLGQDMQRVKQT